MALTVATNTGALMAQAAASSVNKEMEISMERLSTGKRINGASDDAAGVAIASRLSSEIRGTNQAIRNALDAQALIDTAEGAHIEIESILQRMRELAVQSANDTNNTTDRANLNTELTQLTAEINRIAAVTSWAGKSLLDGSASALNFQIGSGTSSANQLTVSLNAMTASALAVADGSTATVSAASALSDTSFASSVSGNVLTIGTAAAGQAAIAAQDAHAGTAEVQTFDLSGETVAAGTQYTLTVGSTVLTSVNDNASLADLLADLQADSDYASSGITLTLTGTSSDQLVATFSSVGPQSAITLTKATQAEDLTVASNVFELDASSFDGSEDVTITVGNTSFTIGDNTTWDASADATALVAAIQADASYDDSGFVVAVDATTATQINVTINNASTSASLVGESSSVATATETTAGIAAQIAVSAQDAVTDETVTVTLGSDSFNVELDVSTYATEAAQAGRIASVLNANSLFSAQYSAVAVGTTVTFTGLDDTFNISTSANAESAIGNIDTAIQTLNTQRATLGAVSNRIDSTVSNLTNISNNLQAGRGRIEDADFAAETTNLAKTQILQQASTAMLAQANAAKQNVLSLLQG